MKKAITLKKAAALILTAVLIFGLFAVFPPQAALADETPVYWTDGVSVDAGFTYDYGSGTLEDPYLITSASELAQLAVNVNGSTEYSAGKYFKLGANIDLSGKWWTPIGNSESMRFMGNFDGNGKTIAGLTIGSDTVSPEMIYAGLFGYIYDASVSDVTLTGVSLNVSSCLCVGALAGYAFGSTNEISGCTASGNITGDRDGACHIGGLIGYLHVGAAADSSADVNLTGAEGDMMGGFTGRIYDGSIESCAASGNVSGGNETGGFVGEMNSDSEVYNSCCTGTVEPARESDDFAGGFVGSLNGVISNCYAAGDVTNGYGFAGRTLGTPTINHCYYNSINTNGFPEGSLFSGTGMLGMSASNMKSNSFLTDLNDTGIPGYTADWNGWQYAYEMNGGYPVLLWQVTPTLTAGTAARTAQDTATVTFTANESGEYYYAVVADGAEAPSISTAGAGEACAMGVNTMNIADLSTGAKDLYLVLKDTEGRVSPLLKMDIPKLFWTDGHDIDDTYGFSGGSGTSGDPYRIATADDLAQLAVNVNCISEYSDGLHFRLTGNIDLAGSRWTPIGWGQYLFTGTLDGGGYAVGGLSVVSADYQYAGLFGFAAGATFRNLTVGGTVTNTYSDIQEGEEERSVTNCYAGGILACGINVQFDNCRNEAAVTANASADADTYGYAGGIAGYLTATSATGAVTLAITGCSNEGAVTASVAATDDSSYARSYAGGIVGRYFSRFDAGAVTLAITQCENSETIEADSTATAAYGHTRTFAGGIIGDAIAEGDYDGTFLMTDCSNSGAVSIDSDAYYASCVAGGLAGELIVNKEIGDAVMTIESCRNSGAVSTAASTANVNSEIAAAWTNAGADNCIGGIVGYAYTSADYDSTLIISDCVCSAAALTSESTGYAHARCASGGIAGRANAYTYESSASAVGSLVIKGCFNAAQISGTATQLNDGMYMHNTYCYTGGIAGYTSEIATILSCYNRGAVAALGNSIYFAGGIDGYAWETGNISSCYNTGAVTSAGSSAANTGGAVGYLYEGTVSDCYWLAGTAGAAAGTDTRTAADESCTSVTQEELRTSGFVTALNTAATAAAAAYGISDMPVWAMAANLSTNDGYPVLTWPVPPVVNPGGGSLVTITNPDGTKAVTGTVTKTASGKRVTVGGAGFALVADAGTGVVFNTGSEIVTFSNRAAAYIADAAGTGDVVLTINEVDPASLGTLLTEAELARIGDRPVYDFTLTANGSELSDFGGGNATITIPYTPRAGELPFAVVIYYIDAAGNLISVRGFYDAATGMVTFRTNHFSMFAVGYHYVGFSDVAADAWYGDAVGFIAARGITEGMDATHFAPGMNLTRAQFLVMLMRAYGFLPDSAPADSFDDAGNTWYTGYLSAGKASGLTNGVGDNLFAPDCEITRQEMFTMLYNALRVLEELPAGAGEAALSDFEDAGEIDSWAGEAMQALVEGGVVSGNGGRLSPKGPATRAEMAQVLTNILGQ